MNKKENPNKKTISIALSIIIAALIIFVIVTQIINNNLEKNAYVATNIKEVDDKFPESSILILGEYNIVLNKEELNELIDRDSLQVYNFDAITSINGKLVSGNWTGIKAYDLFISSGIIVSKAAYFKAPGYLSIGYRLENINDDLYIVFENNGEPFKDEAPLQLINLKLDSSYWLFDLERIDVDKYIEDELR